MPIYAMSAIASTTSLNEQPMRALAKVEDVAAELLELLADETIDVSLRREMRRAYDVLERVVCELQTTSVPRKTAPTD